MTDDFQANPHPTYARWRRTEPVRRIAPHAWLVTRYDDARRALADPRLSKATGGLDVVSRHMLGVDPPDHTRLRRLVSAAFTARRIEMLRPRIEEITDDLLDAMAGREHLDLIDAFAFPLPIQVICDLLGIPADDRDSFRAWSNVLVTGFPVGDVVSSRDAMVAYIQALVADRRRHGGDDLLAGLVEVRDNDDRLSEAELISMVFLLLIAGHETTVNLIGNGAFLLLSSPDRWARLRAERTLLPTAIEEFLRYEGPVETATFRTATEDFEIAGERIARGDQVVVGLLAANRDERFADADELVLDRAQNPHLAFGHGIHYCLGAPLARLEAQIAFDRLLDRYPELTLDARPGDLAWRPGLIIRGLVTLPVRNAAATVR